MTNGRTRRRDWRKFGFLGLGIFVAVFLFSFLARNFGKTEESVDAANMGNFQAGYIISDFQMTDYESMTEAEIQNFLWSKGRCYNTNFSGVGARVDYFSDVTPPTTWHVSDGHTVCLAEENMRGESAAHIIWQAAQDYRINPKVLIVLLQKETGVITDPIPNSWDYQRATGYGCPDTAACSDKYYGFKNQVRNAAYLFRVVMDGNSSYFPIGNNAIQFKPNSNCGSSTVNIQNLATSALYRYTPYQPNGAALASSYGSGDGCSSYGNRNFYSYYEDWFGNITDEGLPVPETSHVVEGEYIIQSTLKEGMVMDVAGGSSSDGANLQLFSSNGSIAQKWLIVDNGDGTYMVKNAATGKVLDVAGGRRKNGTNVQTFTSNDSCAQKWAITRDTNGAYTFYSVCSGRVLDVMNGWSSDWTNIQIYEPNNTASQKWNLLSTSAQLVGGGEYVITSNVGNGIALDVNGGSNKDFANVQIYQTNDTEAQNWQMIYSADGYYRVVNASSRKGLDVSKGGTVNGTNVQLYEANTTCSQKWQVVKNSDNSYSLYSACSGLALDIMGGDKNNGANVQIYEPNGTNAQKWTFKMVTATASKLDGVYAIKSSLGENMVIDISSNNSANGTNIQQWDSNNSNAQKWQFKSDGAGYYTIVNPANGKALDVAGGGVKNSTNVHLWESNDTLAQKWQIVSEGNDIYTIYSARSGLVLDVAYGSDRNGANIQTYESNGTNAQRWRLLRL
ncbi:MAG: RICIN domain-containing protein [Candidatus Saccharibacteria bacterium]|nr:RICIN domain-containing protein [Candidatus Saccharibacteria bacterium]